MANVFTHKETAGYQDDSGTVSSVVNTFTGDHAEGFDEAIAPSTTNQLVAASVDVSRIRSCMVYCDKAITLKTNSSSSPADTITLTAGQLRQWNTGHAEANFFTTDITAIYITTGAIGSTANLKVRFLIDNTLS